MKIVYEIVSENVHGTFSETTTNKIHTNKEVEKKLMIMIELERDFCNMFFFKI